MSITLDSYNESAEKYNQKFSEYEPYKKQIRSFLSLFNEASDILDAGCGSGLNAKTFAEAGHRVTGFDFSSSMIEIAKQNCPGGDFRISTVQNFDTERLFDGILLSFIIVHLSDEDAEGLIDRVSRMIKPGGYIYISFMTGKMPGWETTSFSDSDIFFNYYEADNIIRRFVSKGFRLESRDSEPYPEGDGTITEDVFLVFRNG